MGRKRTPGLYKRKGYWHIDKQIFGRRVCESTSTCELAEAETYLARRAEEIRQAMVYGVRPGRHFNLAAAKFLMENQHLASLDRYADALRAVQPYIGEENLHQLQMGSLQKFIDESRRKGKKTRTINYSLQIIRRILNLAANEWMDEHGLTWLVTAPKIKLLPEHDKKPPYPLSWDEQARLFKELPEHLKNMALFAVNTGCREAEICALQWSWEIETHNLAGGSLFIVPKGFVKNREDRLIIINDVARKVIESCRGQHPIYVFTYHGKRLQKINNEGWRTARKRVGLEQVRVHDLKHTFGRRLRAAGISFEDRQDLLGHKSGRITTHYSAAELKNLYDAANSVCQQNGSYPTLAVLKQTLSSRKSPALDFVGNVVKLKNVASY